MGFGKLQNRKACFVRFRKAKDIEIGAYLCMERFISVPYETTLCTKTRENKQISFFILEN